MLWFFCHFWEGDTSNNRIWLIFMVDVGKSTITWILCDLEHLYLHPYGVILSPSVILLLNPLPTNQWIIWVICALHYPRHPGPPAEVWYLDPPKMYLEHGTSGGIWMYRVSVLASPMHPFGSYLGSYVLTIIIPVIVRFMRNRNFDHYSSWKAAEWNAYHLCTFKIVHLESLLTNLDFVVWFV